MSSEPAITDLIRRGHPLAVEKELAEVYRDRFLKTFTEDQKAALREYKLDSRGLREVHIQRDIKPPSPKMAKIFASLDTVFTPNGEWLHVCHGYGLPVLAEGRASVEDTKPNDITRQLKASYISTTMFTTCQRACDYGDGQTILHLLLSPATPGFYMGAVDDLVKPETGENEYILPPGLEFKVVGTVEVLPDYCKSEDRPWVLPSRHIYALVLPSGRTKRGLEEEEEPSKKRKKSS